MRAFFLILAFAFHSLFAHEAPVDHLERELSMWVQDNEIRLSYRVQLPERAVMMQLKTMDADNNGLVSPQERETFFVAQARAIAELLRLVIANRSYTFQPSGSVQLDAAFGQTYTFSIPIESLKGGEHSVTFTDDYSTRSPGGYRYLPHPKAHQLQLVKAIRSQRYRNHPDRITLRFKLNLK